ncbi:MAG: Siroheme synthase / Precorrin-2 oxidase / Sirohydrochlorin ferrochelatase / Uroporphyrinogen-III [Sphingomonas bacterium]|uniref:NAD(P)-dependent oxidoreductase n=1 Tax=Sphingomonas bacterium TaxID=1895847 RepID=UPI00261F628A|nr:NAD(P)-dependent oxidoreductase [Sphingomonas bacterium]MDB5706674.1 Siroheme synthase / Precorrin-2 oxidase / Sirohydrochlorin ferrochelatase / Uroporphyrinogen-III [Sphingomonas bacterium]
MTLHSLPLFVRLAGRPVILLGDGEAADAKRRLLERAGAVIGDEGADAVLAVVAIADERLAGEAVARLKARGVLVNAVDRPDWCDFTLPAIIDRDPVLIAIGTGGASAGLAAALRQRLEAIVPAGLGGLANALRAARAALREKFPESDNRRRALGAALAAGGALDPLTATSGAVDDWLAEAEAAPRDRAVTIRPRSADPDDLTIREARLLGLADRLYHRHDVPAAILDRARADAVRIICTESPVEPGPGLAIYMEMA